MKSAIECVDNLNVTDSSQVRPNEWLDVVSHHAASLALIEVALGSALHGFKIPFGGHWLSLNQGAFLTRVVRALPDDEPARATMYVSNISATLKSLSPAGNKLGPMLSISVQGFLFSIPIAIAGARLVTICAAMTLLSLWAFLQPFITLFVLYGSNLQKAFAFYIDLLGKLPPWLPFSLGGLIVVMILIKITLAIAVGWFAFRSSDQRFSAYQTSLLDRVPKTLAQQAQSNSFRGRVIGSLRETIRPYFLISLVLMGIFFFVQEGSVARTLWLLMRPIALGFVIFYFARSPMMARFASALRRSQRFHSFMRAFDLTLRRIRRTP